MVHAGMAPAAARDAGRGVRWLAADEAAAMTRRSVSAVYRLAHRHRWRRYVHNGHTYYDPRDVEHTAGKLTE